MCYFVYSLCVCVMMCVCRILIKITYTYLLLGPGGGVCALLSAILVIIMITQLRVGESQRLGFCRHGHSRDYAIHQML